MPHEHEHDHHSHGGQRFAWVTLLQLAMVAIEVVLGGVFFPNPAIVADAGHNASDVVFIAVAGTITWMTGRYGRAHLESTPQRKKRAHQIETHLPMWAAMVMCIITIVGIGGIVIYEALQPLDTSTGSLVATGVLGVGGFGLNWWMASQLRRGVNGEKPLNRSTAQHLKSDAWVSLILVPTAALTALTGLTTVSWLPRSMMISGAIVIVVVTARQNLGEARHSYKKLIDCKAADQLATR